MSERHGANFDTFEIKARPYDFVPAERRPAPDPEYWPQTKAANDNGEGAPERILFWLFIAGLAWVPFLYGSNVLLAWGINALIFPGLVMVYEISLLIRGRGHPVALRHIWLPAMLFVAVVLWIVVQNATWTPASWQHPIWEMTAQALQRPVSGSISVDRDLTTQGLIRLLTSASVLWLSMQLCRDYARAVTLLTAFGAIVCVYSLYGIVAYSLQGSSSLTWFGDTATLGFVNSTFYNRDHFATFAGLGLVAVCGAILKYYRDQITMVGGYLRHRVGAAIEATAKKGAVLDGAAFITLVALLMSGSRGGVLATGLGLAVLLLLYFGRNSPKRRETAGLSVKFAASLFLVAIAIAITLMFGDTLFGKISGQGFTDENRMAVYVITFRSVLTAPFFGFGYGTFADVFPMFRDRSVPVQGVWEQAHNTYLEVWQGLGVVFGTMLIVCVVLLVLAVVKGALKSHRGAWVCCVGASVSLLIGAHAIVDFSLQIQAITISFMALLGAAVAQSVSSRVSLSDWGGLVSQALGTSEWS